VGYVGAPAKKQTNARIFLRVKEDLKTENRVLTPRSCPGGKELRVGFLISRATAAIRHFPSKNDWLGLIGCAGINRSAWVWIASEACYTLMYSLATIADAGELSQNDTIDMR